MTNSQIISIISTLATIISAIATKLITLTDILPPSIARWLPVVVIVAGVITTALSQSLSLNHVSVPVEKAAALPVKTQQELGIVTQVERLT